MSTDLASLEVWKETAEYLAQQAASAEAGSDRQAIATAGLVMFCTGQLSVEEVDDALNGG